MLGRGLLQRLRENEKLFDRLPNVEGEGSEKVHFIGDVYLNVFMLKINFFY